MSAGHDGEPKLAADGYEVTEPEAGAIAALADSVGIGSLEDASAFCGAARYLARQAPDGLVQAMLRFEDVGSSSGAFVVSGLHTGPVPETPLDNTSAIGAGTPYAAQVAVVAQILGEMVYYEAEGTGHLLQDMVPNPAKAEGQSSQGSKAELEAHTEQSFSPMRPDYVVLGCLRGDPEAETYVMSARKIASHFTPDELEYLGRPLWTTLIDDSFHALVPDPGEVRGPFALLSGTADDPMLRLDQELTHGMTAQAQRLLERVLEVYKQNHHSVTLQAGQIGFVDNTRAMHGRSSFEASFDGTDRFVIRGFVVRDLRRTSPARELDGREIRAAFS
jgi:L-asparagine oxygenase